MTAVTDVAAQDDDSRIPYEAPSEMRSHLTLSRAARRSLAGVAFLLVALVVAPGSAAAGDLGHADILFARFDGDVQGLMLLHGDFSTFSSGLIGLEPTARYRVIGSASGCGADAPHPALWKTGRLMGDGFFTGPVEGGPFLTTRSVQLMRTGVGRVACTRARFARTSTPPSTAGQSTAGALASFGGGATRGIVLLEKLDADRVRFVGALHGLTPHHDYRVAASTAPCGEASSPDQTVSFIQLSNTMISGYFKSATGFDKEVEGVRSIRVRDAAGGLWDCRPAGIIAVLIGL